MRTLARKNRKVRPEQEGDVLGISHAKGTIPHPPSTGHSNPEGIDVRPEPGAHTGIEDVEQGSGATSIDMGSGGSGNAIRRERK